MENIITAIGAVLAYVVIAFHAFRVHRDYKDRRRTAFLRSIGWLPIIAFIILRDARNFVKGFGKFIGLLTRPKNQRY